MPTAGARYGTSIHACATASPYSSPQPSFAVSDKRGALAPEYSPAPSVQKKRFEPWLSALISVLLHHHTYCKRDTLASPMI